jgi:hypothetical protein
LGERRRGAGGRKQEVKEKRAKGKRCTITEGVDRVYAVLKISLYYISITPQQFNRATQRKLHLFERNR